MMAKHAETVSAREDATPYEPSPAELEAQASSEELREVSEAIDQAEEFVLSKLGEEAMYPREVTRRRNGEDLPAAAISMAFWRLVNSGKVELGADRIARLAKPPHQNGGAPA